MKEIFRTAWVAKGKARKFSGGFMHRGGKKAQISFVMQHGTSVALSLNGRGARKERTWPVEDASMAVKAASTSGSL